MGSDSCQHLHLLNLDLDGFDLHLAISSGGVVFDGPASARRVACVTGLPHADGECVLRVALVVRHGACGSPRYSRACAHG